MSVKNFLQSQGRKILPVHFLFHVATSNVAFPATKMPSLLSNTKRFNSFNARILPHISCNIIFRSHLRLRTDADTLP